jgi:hypothetical protein
MVVVVYRLPSSPPAFAVLVAAERTVLGVRFDEAGGRGLGVRVS